MNSSDLAVFVNEGAVSAPQGVPAVTAGVVLDPAPTPKVIPFLRSELDLNIVERFRKVASQVPNHIALRGMGKEWTYAALWSYTEEISHAIRQSTNSGIGCVAYLADHSPEMVIAALSILKAGKAYLCIHPSLPSAAKEEILGDALPDLLLHTQTYAAEVRALAEKLPNLSIQLLEERIDLSVKEPGQPDAEWTIDQIEELFYPATESDAEDIAATSPAVIFYTSGSTGKPKGVVKNHRIVLHRAWLAATDEGICPSDRQSLLTYCSFASSEADMFGVLLNGATLELFDVLENGLLELGKWIDEHQITVLHPPVVLFRRYLSTLKGSGNHPSIRLVVMAGESVLPADVELWQQTFAKTCQLRHRFSATETSNVAVAIFDASTAYQAEHMSMALPASDKFLSIVDENKQLLPPGHPGQLVVTSKFLASGYWRRLEDTMRDFVVADEPDQRSFYSGDVGSLSADGRFTFIGRKDGQVKIRGYRVEIREIENSLLEIDNVSEVAVVVDRSQAEPVLVAFVVMKPGTGFDAQTVQSELLNKLPPWKVPASFHGLPTLPLTLTGKIDRPKLLGTYQALPKVSANSDCDPDTTLGKLINIWQSFFPHAEVVSTDNFLALGGHSIMSLTLVARVTEKFNVNLPLNAAYMYETVAEMAAAIDLLRERSIAPASQTLRQVTPTMSFYPPLYIIPGGRGLGIEEIASGPFIEHLKDEISAYVLAARTADGKTAGHEHVSDIAQEYLQEIRKVQPNGPYLVLGGCIGGAVAFELCRQIELTGETAYLAMIEGNYITSVRWMREAAQRFSGSRYLREFPRRMSKRFSRVIKRIMRAPWKTKGAIVMQTAKTIADEVDATFYIRSEGFFITPQERFHLQYRKAISRYRPGEFSGDAKLLLSSQYAKRPFVKNWQRVMRGRFDVEYSPSTHAEVLTDFAEPSAMFVKRFYREALAKHPELEQAKALEQTRTLEKAAVLDRLVR